MGAPDITPIEPADHADASAAHPRRLTVIADDPSARRASSARRPAGSGSKNQGLEVESGSVREPHARRGPLLAVCGLCGGAGTSTLAYLIALFTARRHADPVLVCDTGGPDGGLADHAGVAAPRSLVEVAEHVTTGLPPGRVYVTGADGVRVLATGPRFTPDCAADGVKLVLDDARGAHALTVVDCGTLTRAAEQIALAAASHIAWVLPATPRGVRRGERVLGAVNPYLLGGEIIMARRDEREPKAALDELKRLARDRDATLVLVPHLPEISDAGNDAALDAAQVSLQAIHGVLAR
jgi:MinD-like ATPase involved in chromosome partitioning or flagellar assembly